MNNPSLFPDWTISQWFNSPKPLSLHELRGKVVVIHAFQMLCPGCVSHALPQANNTHEAFDRKDLVVIGLHSVFEHHQAMAPVSLEAFIHEYKLKFPIGVDTAVVGNPIPLSMQRYALRGTPSLLVVDRAGRLRAHQFGRVDDLRLGALLGQLVAESVVELTPTQNSQNDDDNVCNDDGCIVKP